MPFLRRDLWIPRRKETGLPMPSCAVVPTEFHHRLSAPLIDVFYSNFGELSNAEAYVRPDLIPGSHSIWFGAQCAGDIFQASGAACSWQGCPEEWDSTQCRLLLPLFDANGSPPAREFGSKCTERIRCCQWDFAVHREFAIREQLKLQFRAEMFNVLIILTFGQPSGNIRVRKMLALRSESRH